MGQLRRFLHSFEDLSEDGMLSIDMEPPLDAVIRIELEEGEKVWLSANRAGWLHLARVCAELALGNYEPGFHLHQDFHFQDSDGTGPEITLEVRDEHQA